MIYLIYLMAAIFHWGCHLRPELQYGVHTHTVISKLFVILYIHQLDNDNLRDIIHGWGKFIFCEFLVLFDKTGVTFDLQQLTTICD